MMVRHDGGPGWVMQWDRRLQWVPVNGQYQKRKKRRFLTQHLCPDEETEEDLWHLLGHREGPNHHHWSSGCKPVTDGTSRDTMLASK